MDLLVLLRFNYVNHNELKSKAVSDIGTAFAYKTH